MLVSNGFAVPGAISWGAIVADQKGIIALIRGGTSCDVSYSWAAEWAGKLAAAQLATSVGIPNHRWRLSVADNISATLGPDGGKPSRSPVIDAIRLAFAKMVAGSHVMEAYTPAEHNTGWSHTLSAWQAECHDLAASGSRDVNPWSYPFPDVLGGCALLFCDGRLVLDVGHTMDRLYCATLPSPLALLATLIPDTSALPATRVSACSPPPQVASG